MYVTRKGREFVAKPGSKSSYTSRLQGAQIFDTEEEARANKCDNEAAIPVYHALHANY